MLASPVPPPHAPLPPPLAPTTTPRPPPPSRPRARGDRLPPHPALNLGSKTTLDFVNSFPHLRNPHILPRLDTTLLHGMTVELFDPRAKDGFKQYLGWVSRPREWAWDQCMDTG